MNGMNRKDGAGGVDRLWDSQWVNIVNAPEVLNAESQEDAVNIAVRMTEQKMAENARLREPAGVGAALRIAHRHLDMAAMRISHCKDAAAIEAALAATQPPAEAQSQGGGELSDDIINALDDLDNDADTLRSTGDRAMSERIRGARNVLRAAIFRTAPPSEPETEENVAADSYHYMTELLEPYVAREGSNPNGPFPASVVESFQMLLEHWKATRTASPSAPVASEHVRRLVGHLAQWVLCMSHNESYFGEAAGHLKSTVEELARSVDPIYPPKPSPSDSLAGVEIHTATVPFMPAQLPTTTAPPSAPVGVIGDAIRHLSKWLDLNDCECESGHQCGRTEVERTRDQLRALAQQPASDGGFTAADMMDARQEGRKEAQQPAAVDGAYPAPRNRAEAAALARLALSHLGVIDAHIDAAIARCETNSVAQPGGPQ